VTGNSAQSAEHTLECRYADTTTPTAALTAVDNFLRAITASVFVVGWRPIRARVQTAGTDFSIPIALPTSLAAFVGVSVAAFTPDREAVEFRWVGRDLSNGRRASVSLYGLNVALSPNFRWPVGGSSPAMVAASVNFLNGSTAAFISIGRNPVAWYSYVNTQYNSYWETQLRTA
jgi:hypothetical protein